MWHLLVSSPILMFLVVLYVIDLVAVLIYATFTRDHEPRRNDGQPSPPADHQESLPRGPRWSHVESDKRFSRVLYSCYVDPDRRLWAVHHWCSTGYAKMLAEASERIRL